MLQFLISILFQFSICGQFDKIEFDDCESCTFSIYKQQEINHGKLFLSGTVIDTSKKYSNFFIIEEDDKIVVKQLFQLPYNMIPNLIIEEDSKYLMFSTKTNFKIKLILNDEFEIIEEKIKVSANYNYSQQIYLDNYLYEFGNINNYNDSLKTYENIFTLQKVNLTDFEIEVDTIRELELYQNFDLNYFEKSSENEFVLFTSQIVPSLNENRWYFDKYDAEQKTYERNIFNTEKHNININSVFKNPKGGYLVASIFKKHLKIGNQPIIFKIDENGNLIDSIFVKPVRYDDENLIYSIKWFEIIDADDNYTYSILSITRNKENYKTMFLVLDNYGELIYKYELDNTIDYHIFLNYYNYDNFLNLYGRVNNDLFKLQINKDVLSIPLTNKEVKSFFIKDKLVVNSVIKEVTIFNIKGEEIDCNIRFYNNITEIEFDNQSDGIYIVSTDLGIFKVLKNSF